MVFIKLQYKDNIKKILIAKEEINWLKICEILHQIFKLEDSRSIRLVYKDEEEESQCEIEIKSNQELLETINKKLIRKFIKFFVFYSGVVENDSDALYTSLIDNDAKSNSQLLSQSQLKRKGSANLKGKKKTTIKKLEIVPCELSQSKNSNNEISQQQNNILIDIKSKSTDREEQEKKEISSLSLQRNALIQVETQEQFKNILSQAINKSHVFEEIKDKIKEFINESSTQNQFNGNKVSEQKISNDQDNQETERQEQKKTIEEIEYSIQTNLQHLSDLFVQNIREVIDEQLALQLDIPSSYQKNSRKYSEDLFDKRSKQFKNNLPQLTNQEVLCLLSSKESLNKKSITIEENRTKQQGRRIRTQSAKLDIDELTDQQNNSINNYNTLSSNNCSINNTRTNNNNLLQESIYTPTPQQDTFNNRTIKRKNTNSEKILEIIQEQEEKITNIEENLEKTQRLSEQQINQQFEQNFRSIHHLFQSIRPTQNFPEAINSDLTQLQRNITISAHELYLLLDKQVQQYSLQDRFKDDDDYERDLTGPSFFDSLVNEQIILKSKPQKLRSQFLRQYEIQEPKESKKVQELTQKLQSVLKVKSNEDDQKLLHHQKEQQQLLEETIVQVVSPLRSFMNSQQQQQSDRKSMLQLINTEHFNINTVTENTHPSLLVLENQSTTYDKNNQLSDTSAYNCSSIDHSSKEIIDEVDFDQQLLPKLIMTKKISQKIVQIQ